MNNTWKRLILFSVLLGMFVCAFAACGKKKTPVETGEVTTPEETTEPVGQAPVIPKVDYAGQEFVMLLRAGGNGGNPEDMFFDENPSGTGTIVDGQVWARNQRVEETTGITLRAERSSSNNSDYDQLQPILMGDTTYDVIANHGRSMLAQYATKNTLLNWYDIPYVGDSLEFEWWDQGMREDFTVNGKLWVMSGDLSWMNLGATIAMILNKRVARENNLDYPYDLMKAGTWTLEEFKTMVQQVNSNINDETKFTPEDGDHIGYMTSRWRGPITVIYSGGGALVSNNGSELELTINTPRNEQLYTDYFNILDMENVWYSSGGWGVSQSKTFANSASHVLFMDTRLTDVSYIQEETTDYGVLPWPKYDESVDKYYAWRDAIGNCFGVPKTLAADSARMERVGVVLELLCRYGNEKVIPAFYQRVLLARYSNDDDGKIAIDYIKEGRRFDLAASMFKPYLSDFGPYLADREGHSFATAYAEIRGNAEKDVADVNIMFGDLGYE